MEREGTKNPQRNIKKKKQNNPAQQDPTKNVP